MRVLVRWVLTAAASVLRAALAAIRGMTSSPALTQVLLSRSQASSANNSVGGGSPLPGTPQKPDEYANDGLDDLKATIKQAQVSTGCF